MWSETARAELSVDEFVVNHILSLVEMQETEALIVTFGHCLWDHAHRTGWNISKFIFITGDISLMPLVQQTTDLGVFVDSHFKSTI